MHSLTMVLMMYCRLLTNAGRQSGRVFVIIYFPLHFLGWVKLNSSPVCFGAKHDHFGKFHVPPSSHSLWLASIKLVHKNGYVSCETGTRSNWSYWGCAGLAGQVNVVITTSANHIILPAAQYFVHHAKWSRIPGYNSLSPELVMSFPDRPHQVNSGQELRLWYGEDLVNWAEGDNGGYSCCDVYARFGG